LFDTKASHIRHQPRKLFDVRFGGAAGSAMRLNYKNLLKNDLATGPRNFLQLLEPNTDRRGRPLPIPISRRRRRPLRRVSARMAAAGRRPLFSSADRAFLQQAAKYARPRAGG